MDQNILKFEMVMLYYDLVDLILIIEESNNSDLIDYLPFLKSIIDEA